VQLSKGAASGCAVTSKVAFDGPVINFFTGGSAPSALPVELVVPIHELRMRKPSGLRLPAVCVLACADGQRCLAGDQSI
jgi:hypothetical protein